MKVHNPNNLPTAPIADLLPTQGDLKDLTDTNYKKLKGVIERRGFSYPVYVWEDSKGLLHLLDGHQRQRVLTTEGWNDPIPYLKVPAEDLQEAAARLLEITSQYATITQEGIDEFIATYDLNEAEVLEATAFDATRFQTEEEPEVEVEEDEAPEVSDEPPVSELGKVYQLGRHRVMCGDSTSANDSGLLMEGVLADMVFTDPPYGVDYDGGATSKRDKLASDNKNTSIYKEALPNIYVHSKNSAALYIWHAAGYADMATELTEANYVIRNQLIWNKNQAQYGALSAQYKQKHEPCFYAHKKGQAPSWYGDTKQTTVWDISRESKNEHHPTQKPVELVGMALRNSSKAGDTVLDLFLGSGSTLIACEQTDRTCYGMELDPKYVDVIRKRYAKFTNNNELPDNWEELTPAIARGKQDA